MKQTRNKPTPAFDAKVPLAALRWDETNVQPALSSLPELNVWS